MTEPAPPEGAVAKRPKWTGVVEVCNTCDRQARWPFCEHRVSGSQWYRLVRVREVGR